MCEGCKQLSKEVEEHCGLHKLGMQKAEARISGHAVAKRLPRCDSFMLQRCVLLLTRAYRIPIFKCR